MLPKSTAKRPRKWKTRIPGIRNAILPATTTRPNPLVTADKVVASLVAPGTICALERRTGRLIWSRELGAYGSAAVSVLGQTVYATSCRSLFSLNLRDGNINWTFSPQAGDGEWIYSQPVA